MRIKIIDIFELKERDIKIASFTGEDIRYGMMVKRVSTPYGMIEARSMEIVKEACFRPGHYWGGFGFDKSINIQPCEAEVLEYGFYNWEKKEYESVYSNEGS